MHVPSLIEKKRDGGELSSEEIAQVISGFTRGEIPDYQMSALAMAIFFRGMSDMETWYLTKAMLESGQIFDYPPNTPPKVDKHSTGAIGGKTSLVLAPLLACDDLWVPMISGRGLYAGKITAMDAEKIGRASFLLGGGRQQVDDKIDLAVGISDLKKIGESVQRDEPLMRVHARTNDALEQVLPLLRTAAVIGNERDL